MKKAEIKVGGKYRAKVSGQLTTVRVDEIGDGCYGGKGRYDCTNLRTGRRVTFRSAQKFRSEVTSN